MDGLQDIRTYREFKEATDREVYNQAEGFVRLGYLLRRAEDTDILLESGYKTVTEFARAEYGLTETYVSRYISINKRYSEGGYSDRLMERFQGFGLAKLADMLTLPDGVVEALPAEATRAEIQELKREVAQEQQVSDLEVLMEQQDRAEEGLLARMLREYYHGVEKLAEYREAHAALWEPDREKRKRRLADALAPAGDALKLARVPGVGRLMLAIKGANQAPELLNVRNGEKRSYTWEELQAGLEELMGGREPEQSWEEAYGEPYPEERESEKSRKKAPVVGIAKPGAGRERPERQPEREPKKPELAPVQKAGKESAWKPEKNDAQEPEEEEAPAQEKGGPEESRPAPVQEPEWEPGRAVKEPPVPWPAQEGKAAPGSEGEEPSSGQQEPEKDGGVDGLKEGILEETEKIRLALEKNYYSIARMAAKSILALLDEIGKALNKRDVPGQMEMKEWIGQPEGQKGEPEKEAEEDEADHMADT